MEKEDLIKVNPKTTLQRPWRSPIEIPELLAPYYKGKRVIEVGCAAGDFIPTWSKYAKRVIGYEYDFERYKLLTDRQDLRGLDNVSLERKLVLAKDIPEADFYYVWLDNKKQRVSIREGLIELGAKGVFAYYGGWSTRDLLNVPEAYKMGMYEYTDEEYEQCADEVIYFHSKELDNRDHYDAQSRTNEFRIIIERL
jgi:hypothetical protein